MKQKHDLKLVALQIPTWNLRLKMRCKGKYMYKHWFMSLVQIWAWADRNECVYICFRWTKLITVSNQLVAKTFSIIIIIVCI